MTAALMCVVALAPSLSLAEEVKRHWGQADLHVSGGVAGINFFRDDNEIDAVPSLGGGAGVEFLVYRGLGLGLDADLAWYQLANVNANLSYHFVSRVKERKIVPFVTAGYTEWINGLSL